LTISSRSFKQNYIFESNYNNEFKSFLEGFHDPEGLKKFPRTGFEEAGLDKISRISRIYTGISNG